MADFKIEKQKPLPRNEQETIITYDHERQEWHLYSDVGKHARKYERLIVPSEHYPSRKIYHETTGELIGIDGKINGIVIVQQKRTLTEEERQRSSERLKAIRNI